jgi:transposase
MSPDQRTAGPITIFAHATGSSIQLATWAILASIINSAKLHELDPETSLADVLERIVSGRTKANALHELLPWTWKAAHAASAEAAA